MIAPRCRSARRHPPQALEHGYWRAYRDFYRWGSILQGAWSKQSWAGRLRHVAYAGGWKKLEPLWDWLIRAQRVAHMLPVLERVLGGFGGRSASAEPQASAGSARQRRRANRSHASRVQASQAPPAPR